MQAVVLAGGLGTRLRAALPVGVPKPMAEVAGRPFLEHVLDQAIASGADRFLLLVSHAAEAVTSHFGPSYRGAPIAYSAEPEPLGTGGALRYAIGRLEPEFVLLNGDTYVEIDLVQLIRRLAGGELSLALVRADDTTRFGRVDVAGGVVKAFTEKGVGGAGVINAGVYGCRREVVDLLPEGPSSFEQDLMIPNLAQLRPRFTMAGPTFFDIGVPEDYRAADAYFRAQQVASIR